MGRTTRDGDQPRYVGAFFEHENQLLLVLIQDGKPWEAFLQLRRLLRARPSGSAGSVDVYALADVLRSLPEPRVDERFASELETRLRQDASACRVVTLSTLREVKKRRSKRATPGQGGGSDRGKAVPSARRSSRAGGVSSHTLLVS